MKNAALAALLLAAPAFAQDRAAEIEWENHLREMADKQAAQSVERAKKIAAIERTLVAMNDGVEAGGRVVAYIEANGVEVKLGDKVQTEPVSVVVRDGKTKIYLSESLPAYPRVYGPLIAKEIAALMYSGMPECSERSYMRRGTAGRVWLELGGDPKDLPIVEPITAELVAAVSDEIAPWADKDGAQMALYKIGEREKLKSIPELEDGASKEDAAKLEAANKAFVAFLLDERDARKAAGLR